MNEKPPVHNRVYLQSDEKHRLIPQFSFTKTISATTITHLLYGDNLKTEVDNNGAGISDAIGPRT